VAGAMILLGGAMKIMATMSWEEIAKGLVGIGGGLVAMAAGAKMMGPVTLIMGPALIALAFGLNILALAVKQFASLGWGDLVKGLVGVFGSLVALVVPLGALGLTAPLLVPVGIGLIGVAFAMNMLAGAVLAFGSLDLSTLAKGILGAAAALVALGIGIAAIPPHAALMGAGLILVAIALNGIAAALKVFGGMSVWAIAKGLVALGGSLGILAIGLTAMSGAALGAVTLGIAAAGLALLAPTLAFLGTLKWGTILKGLVAIALALGTVAIAGGLAGPGIAILGAALLPLGLALTAVGAATYFFAAAMQKLSATGTKGIAVFIAAITAFVAVLPKIIIDFLKGVVEILAEMAKLAPKIVNSLTKILNSIIQVVINSTPQLALAIGSLVDAFVQVIVRDSPKLIQAGFTIIMNLLRGVDQNMPEIMKRVTSIVLKFINGLASRASDLAEAGSRVIINFLTGLSKHATRITQTAVTVVTNFMAGLVSLPGRMARFALRAIRGFLLGIGDGIPGVVKAGVRIITRTLDGISSQFDEVARTATRFVVRFFNALGNRKNTRKMANAGFDCAINILKGITDAVKDDKKIEELVNAFFELGEAILEGLLNGVGEIAEKLKDKILAPLKWAAKQAEKVWEAFSPSRRTIRLGKAIVDGLGIGLRGMRATLANGITNPMAYAVKRNDSGRIFGKFLGREFKAGLTGGLFGGDTRSEPVKQIQGAFTALRAKLGEEQTKLRDKLRGDQEKLKQLLSQKDVDWAKVGKLQASIFGDKQALSRGQTASRRLMKSLNDERSSLGKLSKDYEAVSKKLEDARGELDKLKSAQAELVKSTADAYSQLPDADALVNDALAEAEMTAAERAEAQRKQDEQARKRAAIDQVAIYKDALEKQIAATKKYMDTLAKLRELGLDDTTYQKLLEKGTAGQEFASQLLSKGKDGIAAINELDSQLGSAAMNIAKKAGQDLYDAGIKAAQGLVEGLKKDKNEVKKAMEEIADQLVNAIRRKLKIKSPSQVFAKIGQFTGQGLVDGLGAASKDVQDAAGALGDGAAGALTNSLSKISDRVQDGIDSNPVITPVLDLTQLDKDVAKMPGLDNVVPITAAASYGQASAISQQSQPSDAAEEGSGEKITQVNFEQNNTSPKALDDVEIYRLTRNGLSQVKSALGIAGPIQQP
jgi:hypothetical protein